MGIREEQYMQRKEQILQIALMEFIEKGYYGTSTREIAKIAGISSGLMFHYFNSKQELYETLIEIGCSELSLEYEEEDSPIGVLESSVTGIMQLVTQKSFAAKMFLFMGDASYSAAHISEKAGAMLAQHDIIRQSIPLIERGQKLGEIRSGDPHILSIVFWSSVQGVAEAVATQTDELKPKAEWIMDILRKKD